MAEGPGFFTVAPWGYRVLPPWLAHVAALAPWRGTGDEVRGFRRVGFSSITVSGALLFLWLRRIGRSEPLALGAVLFFALSTPVDEIVRVPFLAEPVGILLTLVLLLTLEGGGSLALLGAVFAAGALTKEIFVLLLPGVFFALRPRGGARRAVLATLVAGASAGAIHVWLRNVWAPYPPLAPAAPLGAADVGRSLGHIAEAWPEWGVTLAAAGLPLAFLGAVLPSSRGFLARYGYMLAVTLALPFAAGVYVGESSPAPSFFSEDVDRLLIYALPFVLALALLALERLGRARAQRETVADGANRAHRTSHVANAAAGLGGVALLLFPFAVLDRYRRADLRGSRDGPLVLAIARDTARFATRLERGRPVAYDPPQRRFDRDRSDMRDLERMRWFLRDGWGTRPQYGMGAVRMQAREASLLVPCFTPRDLEVVVTLRGKTAETVTVRVNGTAVGELRAEASGQPAIVRVPAALLFRGDNVLGLVRPDGDARGTVDLLALLVRPAATPAPAR
jgi:hypothetical protein